MKTTRLFLAVGLIVGTGLSAPASASLISGFGLPGSDPSLAGATVVDFSAQTAGTYTSLAVGGVTFGGGNGTFLVTDNLAGSYNTTGRNLQNEQNQGSTSILNFTFASPASAFGFNFGASNEDWLLEAFDASNNLLESHTLTQTWFSNAGDFFGIAASGIASARATQMTHVNDAGVDWILLDNFSYVAGRQSVPEPGSLLLIGLGLAGLSMSRRRAAK